MEKTYLQLKPLVNNYSHHNENKATFFFNPSLQLPLTINKSDNGHEQESYAVADKAIQAEQPFISPKSLTVTQVQRKCTTCEEKEKKAHRKESNSSEITAGNDLENYIDNLNNGGAPLSDESKNFYEPRFGYDFSNVKIHTDSVAAKSAEGINALAYTSGNNIVFNSGQYSPNTNRGKRLLGHELAHVVQQGGADIKKGEKWDAFWDAGPIDAYRAKQLADEALAAAQAKAASFPDGNKGLHNGSADAWRHCYWNCRMTEVIGEEDASEIAANHEKYGGNATAERMMDTWNNEEGRSCSGDCDKCCEDKFYASKLWVLYDGDTKVGISNPKHLKPGSGGTSAGGTKYEKY